MPADLPHIQYIKDLAKVLIDNKLDCIEVAGIKLSKTKHSASPVVQSRQSVPMPELDPSDDEIMGYALSEPMPSQQAISEALNALSEPKRGSRKVRKELVG